MTSALRANPLDVQEQPSEMQQPQSFLPFRGCESYGPAPLHVERQLTAPH